MAEDNAGNDPQKESGISIVNTLSLIIVIGYIAWMPLWMFFPPVKVPPEVLAILNQMIGAWGYAFAAVIGYHIGSSKGSKDAAASNRDALSKLADAAGTVAGSAAAALPAAVAAAPKAADQAKPAEAPGDPQHIEGTVNLTKAADGDTK